MLLWCSERGEVIASSAPVLAWGSLAEDNPAPCNVFTQAPESDQARLCIEKLASDQTNLIMSSFQKLGLGESKPRICCSLYVYCSMIFVFVLPTISAKVNETTVGTKLIQSTMHVMSSQT